MEVWRHPGKKNFPAAGLRWMVKYREGENTLKVVAKSGNTTVEDEITIHYQTEMWGEPSKMILELVSLLADTAEVRVTMLDESGVMCLNASNRVSFDLTGDGRLIDNMGTARGSRTIQMANGRATILVKLNNGKSVVSVQSEGFETELLYLGDDRE